MKPPLTYQLAHAAATDAGNRSMRNSGRTAWNDDDWNAAAAEFNRLWPEPVPSRPVKPARATATFIFTSATSVWAAERPQRKERSDMPRIYRIEDFRTDGSGRYCMGYATAATAKGVLGPAYEPDAFRFATKSSSGTVRVINVPLALQAAFPPCIGVVVHSEGVKVYQPGERIDEVAP